MNVPGPRRGTKRKETTPIPAPESLYQAWQRAGIKNVVFRDTSGLAQEWQTWRYALAASLASELLHEVSPGRAKKSRHWGKAADILSSGLRAWERPGGSTGSTTFRRPFGPPSAP